MPFFTMREKFGKVRVLCRKLNQAFEMHLNLEAFDILKKLKDYTPEEQTAIKEEISKNLTMIKPLHDLGSSLLNGQ